MLGIRPLVDALPFEDAVRCAYVRDKRLLTGLLLYALVCAGGALASEQRSVIRDSTDSQAGSAPGSSPIAASPQIPATFAASKLDTEAFSATDFRPRKQSIFAPDPALNAAVDAPMLRATTVWQRMADYRAYDRVRVLTLWESRASTVSLQAGRRGNPSLQWTSRLMNRDGASRGLLDRLFSVSLNGVGNNLRGSARAALAPAVPKQVNGPPPISALK